MLTILYFNFFRHSRAANFAVSGRIRPTFELIQSFMVVLVTFKKEENPKKRNEDPFQTMLNFELVRYILVVLLTCKNEDLIKMTALHEVTYCVVIKRRMTSLLTEG